MVGAYGQDVTNVLVLSNVRTNRPAFLAVILERIKAEKRIYVFVVEAVGNERLF